MRPEIILAQFFCYWYIIQSDSKIRAYFSIAIFDFFDTSGEVLYSKI